NAATVTKIKISPGTPSHKHSARSIDCSRQRDRRARSNPSVEALRPCLCGWRPLPSAATTKHIENGSRPMRMNKGPETIAERFRRLRREKGITQVEMAELLGTSQPIVSDYERGLLRLHGELIVKLVEILDCSADELLGTQARKVTTGGGNLRMGRRARFA